MAQQPNGSMPTPSGMDSDMWKAYTKVMKDKFFGDLNPDTDVFFAAPISQLGVAAGKTIPQPVTNKALYDIGDKLLDPSSPTYGADVGSYARRVATILSAVTLRKDLSDGARERLNNAKERSAACQAALDALQKKAKTSYDEDLLKGSQSFPEWIVNNYPSYASAKQELLGALSTEYSLRSQIEGPGAAQLQQYRTHSTQSLDQATASPPFTMPASNDQANLFTDDSKSPVPSSSYNVPTYTIDAGYIRAIRDWINVKDKPATIQYSLSDAKNVDWSSFGQQNFSGSVALTPCFFSVTYQVDGQSKTESISAEEAGADLSVTLTASGISTFKITAGDWDPRQSYDYFESNTEITLPASARVEQVIMGYNVGLQVKFSGQVQSKIREMATRAVEHRGVVNFFGNSFGVNGNYSEDEKKQLDKLTKSSESNSISLPGRDNTLPVLLGVKAKKLPAIKISGAS